MRMFITIAAAVGLAACVPSDSSHADKVSVPAPSLVNPAELLLSASDKAQMQTLAYIIPEEDIVTDVTLVLRDGVTNRDCQIPKGSMVASEGEIAGVVYVSITPHDPDPLHPVPVCDQRRSTMTGVGWVMAFAQLNDESNG